ncbi:GNAT family N-acetyltransferase [Leifsonia kafniensis]|uniref:GNAT family N-acetyltransferase n=1 Tax=Leifsonia kafniensis TaxID=475957 RepID=A0ABP7L7K0_9MICO
MSPLLRPRAITSKDSFVDFDCGEPSLNEWLRNRAVANERGGASRTFVSVDRNSQIIAGYYCLSASSLRSEDAPGALKRNMPNPLPVILIGRLAVDGRFAGHGLGASLLQDAVLKSVEAARLVGARALLVHALTEAAENFYTKFGFVRVPHSARVMYLLTADAEATIASITT